MDMTTQIDASNDCAGVSSLLNRVGDKWTVQVVVALQDDARRFNEIKRRVAGISQQMLTRTLKSLERDGLVERCVRPTTPPQVEYRLTELGRSLSKPVKELAEWAISHRAAIRDNQVRYDTNR
ncbi:winged helix-turn-helix transcriptional regulator [Shinella sp. BYT-45]|uniref:winged helix-turn-helix transcriptional regulator n=1 Tax=Shinella sp. BYT-45 TaxID=3377377 RepID=UPI00397FD60B